MISTRALTTFTAALFVISCSEGASPDTSAAGSGGNGTVAGAAALGGAAGSGVAGASAEGGSPITEGVGGAGGSGGGSGGSGGGGAGSAAGSNSPYANFATAAEIAAIKCGGAGCHGGETPPYLIEPATLYGTLTTFVSMRCGNRKLVVPGMPQESAFYLAQAGQCGPDLPKMPLGCVDTCVPDDYLEGVRQWIENGAPP